MSLFLRIGTAAALATTLAGCSMLGGGKAPDYLYTLTPQAPATVTARSAAAGETVTIETPTVPEELRTVRVPVQVNPTVIQYVTDLTWVDTPNELFQSLVAETVRRTTGRVVLDPDQATLDPGLVVTGQLNRFGYDAQQQVVIVEYDTTLATQGGTHVQSRRFRSTMPADGTAITVGPALNTAANMVAMEVAAWIGR